MKVQDSKPSASASLNALDDVSTKPVKGTKVPNGELVSMTQKGEGRDPFDLFEEGLDPANENPLSIDNNDGKLEISVGGFAYSGEEITALAYSATTKRFLIQGEGYQLVINVTRDGAKVWMKEGKSRFEEVVEYTA